jgi:hypothetical protein
VVIYVSGRVDLRAMPGALSRLALASTQLHPDDLPAIVAREAASMGAVDTTIHLADMAQRVLIPLEPPAALARAREIAIDGTVAGRAYRTEAPVVSRGDDGATTMWLPLLDSAERYGVVRIVVDDAVSDEALVEWLAFTHLIGELIANKSAYGDGIAKRRRTGAMTVASEMRWSMLPPLTFNGSNLTISGIMVPAYEVAGDTFDYAVNADTAHIAIIDAVGHGLEASRIANLAVGAYRHSRRLDRGLADKYRAMDAAIAEQFGTEQFATAQLAHLQLSTGDLQWLNAGHPAPMVCRRGRAVDFTAEVCLPVGMASDLGSEPVVQITALEPGDTVLFFTDGVVEARAPTGEEFGRERLADLLVRAVSTGQTPAETLRLLAHAVVDHQAGVFQDDATLVLLVWKGPPVPRPAAAG